MYRQILVDPQDQDLQRIVWRSALHKRLRQYRLPKVTYRTASAPYLATCCLNQFAMDAEENYRQAANLIRNDFYVDDLLSGAASIEEAKSLQD